MSILWQFINYVLISYLIIYLLFHLPFDIIMLIKKDHAKYPNSPFESFFEGFFLVVPSLGFWFYLFGAICGAWYRPNFVMGKCKHCGAKISWLYVECVDCV